LKTIVSNESISSAGFQLLIRLETVHWADCWVYNRIKHSFVYSSGACIYKTQRGTAWNS